MFDAAQPRITKHGRLALVRTGGFFFPRKVLDFFWGSLVLCLPASLLFCFSAVLLLCFSASLLLFFLLLLLFAFPASLLFMLLCFSCFSASLLYLFLFFSASLLSLLLCFSAFVLLCLATSTILLFFSSVMCFCCSTSCSSASLLPVFTASFFPFSFAFFSPVCILNETLNTLGETQRNLKKS